MQSLVLVGIVIATAGLFLFIFSVTKLYRRRWLISLGAGSSSIALLLVSTVVLLAASNLTTYQRLVYEAPVAELSFVEVAPARFNVELVNLETGDTSRFDLLGDEWQLDAQILSWHGLVTLLGLDAQYRLLRLSGRYVDIDQEKSSARSVHALAAVKSYDVWSTIQEYQRWIAWADATYGSAVFLPMVDQARYKVSISRTGLVARPANSVARQAVSRWIGL